jgi:GTP-binding protein
LLCGFAQPAAAPLWVLKANTAFAGSAASPAQFPKDGLPEVAFLGRSNVGKSSLLNALAGVRGLARVSATPGRTRLVNFYRVGHELYLADLPGYGHARVPDAERRGWERLVTSYLLGRATLALCVFVLDIRHQPSQGDQLLRAFLEHHGLPYLLVGTKADKLGRGELARRRRALASAFGRAEHELIAASAMTKLGIDALWRELRLAAARREGAA